VPVKAPLLAALSILVGFAGYASELSQRDVDRYVHAIYVAEGGAKAKVPYGILSVKVRDAAHARRVCGATVRNNWVRWEKAGKPGSFIAFLGARYCPPAADPVGHRNWVRNVASLLER